MTNVNSVWFVCKYGSTKKYGVMSKPYRTAKYFSEHGVETVLIASDSNHLAKYPESSNRYNLEKDSKLTYIWIKTKKYQKSASIARILSWFSFEWHLHRFNDEQLKKPDVIVVSSLSLLTIFYALRMKRKYNCKFVLEIRDIYPLTLTEELGVSKLNPMVWLLGSVEKKGYKEADLIVGTMPKLSLHVRDVLGYEKEVYYSPLGINDYWKAEVVPSDGIDALFPNDNRIVVGYSGSMGTTNALESFIDAIKSLKDNPSLFFVLVGQGDMKDKFKKDLEGCNNVVIGPRIEQAEVPYFLSKCDILYLSTRDSVLWKYGQSMNKIVDYMMAGKPTVASYSGYPSMLNEAGSGVFIDSDSPEAIISAIMQYANLDKNERKAIGEKGKKWMLDNCDNDKVGGLLLERIRAL